MYNLDCSYSFFYIDIKDENNFYSGLFEFVLNENTLLSYAQGKFGIKFSPSVKHYATLYKELRYYIDSEHIEKDISDLEEELATLLKDEYDSETKESGKTVVRLSKIGRIGEYIFHVFLADYFKFQCIIPKFKLTTDMNMSVNGIDTLHLAKEEKMILLGESKVTMNLDNGIKLINRSITGYQKELEEEFILVLSNPYLKLDTFRELFGGIEEFCINFSDFIKKAQINKIGIPIFIAHGSETNLEDIFSKLQLISRKQLFGLETRYYLISLPLINKQRFVEGITKQIRLRMDWYDEQYRKLQSANS